MNVLLFICLACAGLLADEPAAKGTTAPSAASATADPTTEQTASSTDPVSKTPDQTLPTASSAAVQEQPAADANPLTAPAPGAAIPAIGAPPPGEAAPVTEPAVPPNASDNSVELPEGIVPGTSVGPAVEGEEVPETSALQGFLTLLKVIAVLVVPFLLGRVICQTLQLREYSFRAGLVLFTLTIGAAPFVNVIAHNGSWKDALRFGIDLAGGTNLVFAADHDAAKAASVTINAEAMEKTVSAVGRRINPGGTEEITVRRVGTDRIEVIVPKATADKVESIKRQITDLGSLEFDILANIFDHRDIIAKAEPTRNKPNVTDIYDSNNRLIAKWRPVATESKTGKLKEVRPDADHNPPRIVERNGKKVTEFLLVVEPDINRRITGQFLNRASQGMSDQGPCVNFQFNQRGGYLFRQLTSRYQPREGSHDCRLAILLNEEIHSAPAIRSAIGASGQITGHFDQQELDELINVLNAGALDVPLTRRPVNEFTVSPLLGADVQTKGYRAMIISGLSVFFVMLAYYWKPGLIANLCLATNIILLMGMMSLIDATFTLPGLAGVVLTIGMSVDANVLIYERFREERAKGSSLRMTIHNGFHKAVSTIVDSNLTTLITAVVLYIVGTEQIRGFAVALFIGIVISMFTALYMGRLLFDIAERKHWLRDVNMANAVGVTHFPFFSKAKICIGVSCTLILMGLALVAFRGKDNLDIDFRGGSMATVRFASDTPPLSEMQKRLNNAFGEDVVIEQLQTSSTPPQTLVRIRSTKADEGEVSQHVTQAFADSNYKLVHQSVIVGDVAAVPEDSEGDFVGGHQASLTLGEESAPNAVKGAIVEQFREMKSDDGQPRYDEPENLIEVTSKNSRNPTTEFLVQAKSIIAQPDLRGALQNYSQHAESRPMFVELNTFDQAVASETQWVAVTAVVISLLATIAYLWFRFQAVDFGLAAVVAVVHDVFAVLGVMTLASIVSGNGVAQSLGLIDFKLNLSMIAAYLTIVGYSLNDTIVVFDRIRELRGKSPVISRQLVDAALNQTLSRTLLTSFMTLIVVFIMYALGGEGLRGFSFCLFIGIVIGTYSSIFIASPVLVWLMQRKHPVHIRAAA